MMNKPAAFIVVEGGQTWLRTSAETEEAIRTGFIMETVPLYTAPPTREPFGPEERQRLSKAYSTRAEQVAFEEGIIFAEISYGIGVDDE